MGAGLDRGHISLDRMLTGKQEKLPYGHLAMTSQRPAEALIRHLRDAKALMAPASPEPLALDALGDRAGYSRSHFLRAFCRAYGEPPRAYLTRRRIERAKDLLRLVNLTVTEVCLLVGFSSLGSFSARFAELVGVAPTQYRDQVVRSGGPPPHPRAR